jgi:hypothetical protein
MFLELIITKIFNSVQKEKYKKLFTNKFTAVFFGNSEDMNYFKCVVARTGGS